MPINPLGFSYRPLMCVARHTQLDGLVAVNPDDGSLNMVVAVFVNSYIVIVVWILLQVSVAVLLVRARASQRGLALCGLDCDSVTLIEPARLFPLADACWCRPTPAPLQGQFFCEPAFIRW